jgi:hypothetical protein
MTSNEMPQVVGMAPHSDPKADQLLNSNMPQGSPTPTGIKTQNEPNVDVLASSFDEIDKAIDEAMASVSSNGSNSNASS